MEDSENNGCGQASNSEQLRQFSADSKAADPQDSVPLAELEQTGVAACEIEVPPPNEPTLPPPEPTFHHVQAGPSSGQPWLHPDLSQLVCASMSCVDVEILTRQREEKKRAKSMQVAKVTGQVKTIAKYLWDDGNHRDQSRDFVTVTVPLRELKELRKDMVTCDFERHSFHLQIHLQDQNMLQLGCSTLAHPIVPEKSVCHVSAKSKKVTIKMMKQVKVAPETGETVRWHGLGEGYYSIPCNTPAQRARRKRQNDPEDRYDDLINIENAQQHLWQGPPKVELNGASNRD
ncbi:hypothetical protein CYMTET_10199 [Cymbomonas tetramitiformis]|uniref:CS domain-containing protein n=1 Tax=Cymbomonas tetramitiformis TaxID=36881 RepID=A0AAE0GQ02_9CHLO|nr:hypothetical protein CYMTET_10199 [Cymbomonas tetramitiformis]